MKELDTANKQIVALLQENGRITNSEIAERVGLSPATTLERIKKLEREGVIQGYTALVDPEKLSKGTTAFVSVSMSSHTAESMDIFLKAIMDMPEVMECHHVAGNEDYLLKVVLKDIRTYEDFIIHKLTRIPCIGRIKTGFVLSTLKHKTQILVD